MPRSLKRGNFWLPVQESCNAWFGRPGEALYEADWGYKAPKVSFANAEKAQDMVQA